MSIVTGFLNQQLEDIAKELLPHDDFTKVYPNIPKASRLNQFAYAGSNAFGSFGNNNVIPSFGSWSIVADKSYPDWKQLSFGYHHNGAIKANGSLWMWGRNIEGQIGDSTNTQRSSPVQIGTGTDWAYLSVSRQSTHAIKTDGTLWSWGFDDYGQLGLGNIGNTNSPTQVGVGTDWAIVNGHERSTAAIKTDGTLWVWGDNNYGETTNSTGHLPLMYAPSQVGGNTNWKSVQCGLQYIAAFKTDGTLWTWGRNNLGQLGHNNRIDRSSPVQVLSTGNPWVSLGMKDWSMHGIKADGTLWGWGRNDYGQLADGTTQHRSSPIQTLSGGNDWAKAVGTSLGSYAIKNDGSLWAWGENYVFSNGLDYKSSPTQVVGTNYIDLHAGHIYIMTIQDMNIE